MESNEFTVEEFENYRKREGVRGRRTLEMWSKNQQFINACESPIGKEFIRRFVMRIENNRITFQKMDINKSKDEFNEARAKLNESEDILYDFLNVMENQEKILKEIYDSIKK